MGFIIGLAPIAVLLVVSYVVMRALDHLASVGTAYAEAEEQSQVFGTALVACLLYLALSALWVLAATLVWLCSLLAFPPSVPLQLLLGILTFFQRLVEALWYIPWAFIG